MNTLSVDLTYVDASLAVHVACSLVMICRIHPQAYQIAQNVIDQLP